MQACKINGVRRFVYISTRLADAKGLGYPGSKFEAEEKVKESGLPWLILRLGDVYGLGSTSSINKLIRWVSKIKFVPIMGRGEYKLSPVYIADIIPAILDAALNMELEKRAYLIQGPEEVTYLSLVDRISRYLKVRRLKIFIPALVLQLAVPFVQTIKKNLISKDQINRILGITQPLPDPSVEIWDYRPRKLEEGLKSVVNYEKDKG